MSLVTQGNNFEIYLISGYGRLLKNLNPNPS